MVCLRNKTYICNQNNNQVNIMAMKFAGILSASVLGMVLLLSCNGGNTGIMSMEQMDTTVCNVDSLQEDVMEQMDSLANELLALGSKGQIASSKDSLAELSKRDMLVRPDYLLDPAVTTKLVTTLQKRNALAILLVERAVRGIYNMPLNETEKAIARMSIEVNDPALVADSQSTLPLDEIIRMKINYYRKSKKLGSFWGFAQAMLNEQLYLAAQNPDYYLSLVDDETVAVLHRRIELCAEAIDILAQYDPEIADLVATRSETVPLTDKKAVEAFSTVENFRNFLIAYKKDIIDVRNSMLE